MSRIQACLASLKENNKKALVPYVVAGDPTVESTVSIMHALVESGADIIELGVPFSDPMAEGPVIQLAHERALEHKIGLRDVLALVQEFRQKDEKTPVVLMGYANPVEVMGYEAFAAKASEAGVDGVLTVDLPPEEAKDFDKALKQYAMDNIYLIAPTTSPERVELIASQASGYLYYVSLKGVTGAGHLDIDDVKEKLSVIKSKTDLPVCVGFGIKDGDSAKKIANLAEGAVVGSAIVDRIHRENGLELGMSLLSEIRQAIDSL